MPFLSRILPAPLDGGFHREGSWVWCGSVIRDDEGQYHMFASMWTKSVPFSPNWLTNSRVVRATSDTPEGPYAYAEDVLPPRGAEHWDGMMTHNPTIHRWQDKYLLFYTGTTYRADLPDARHPVSAELRSEARLNQRIGLAVASSPAGPWSRPDKPCLGVRPGHWDALMTTNPAPCVLPGGQIHLLYKSITEERSPLKYGVARAKGYDQPFQRVGPDAPISFQSQEETYEDAYVWYQDGQYNMIFNDLTGRFTGEDHAGAHAVSSDGIQWSLADPPKAYSRRVRWTDGSVTTQGSFERPQLLLQNGRPTHLFGATADGPGGFQNARHTWNMVIPLRPQ